MEEVHTTSISNWVFADKPPNPGIIVPIAVVVQPCFVIVVLALKSDRVGQPFTLRPFRTLFPHFTPRFVLRAPGELAVGVGQFLRRAQVVALVPGQHVYRQRLGRVRPQRVLVYIVGAFVVRLRQQADRLMPHGLRHGDEGAGFVEVVDCFTRRAIGLGRAAFPGQVSPSQPNRVKPQPSSRCLRACSFWFQCEPASGRCLWWALEYLWMRRPSGS